MICNTTTRNTFCDNNTYWDLEIPLNIINTLIFSNGNDYVYIIFSTVSTKFVVLFVSLIRFLIKVWNIYLGKLTWWLFDNWWTWWLVKEIKIIILQISLIIIEPEFLFISVYKINRKNYLSFTRIIRRMCLDKSHSFKIKIWYVLVILSRL